jgi:hypothetical protein
MALLNLSLVTKTLENLLKNYFKISPVWSSDEAPGISLKPPDKLDEKTVGIYLYHITEDSQYKNLPAPGNDQPPVRYSPMALNLYYQLTAQGTDADPLLEQLMIGIAIKAFHDYPYIDDSTEIISGIKLFPKDLREKNNRLRIVLQPITHNEAVSYWTAGTSPLRLAAYYQISVVLLEPEETQSRAGKVLEYGVFTFIKGPPRLDFSQNFLVFNTPDGTDHKIQLRPAQVPVGNQVSFFGSGLSGDSVSLLLKNLHWDEPVEVDPSWLIETTADLIVVEIQETAGVKVVIPGIYSALVKVTRKHTLKDGSTRDIDHISNECPFTITPRIDSISAPDPVNNNIITVKGYIFKHTGIGPKEVHVYVGEVRLVKRTAAASDLIPGEFTVVDPPAPGALPELKLQLPTGLASGQHIPLRIFVNGVESPPKWITVP